LQQQNTRKWLNKIPNHVRAFWSTHSVSWHIL